MYRMFTSNKDASPLCRAKMGRAEGTYMRSPQGSLGPAGPLRQVTPATHCLCPTGLATLGPGSKPLPSRLGSPRWGFSEQK